MRNEPRTRRPRLTFDGFLMLEEQSPQKHEYVMGEMYAVSGGTRRHSVIAANIVTRLTEKCRGTACHAYQSDMLVRPTEDVGYYPDASVDCAPFMGEERVMDRPCLVVEVTSRSTVRVDRGEKAHNYRLCESLETYLIVDQNRRRVTWHRRDSSRAWVVEEVEVAGAIELPCVGGQLSLDEIYEGVELPPLGVAEPDVDELTGAYVVDP